MSDNMTAFTIIYHFYFIPFFALIVGKKPLDGERESVNESRGGNAINDDGSV